ncbi:MAG: TetR/AcrR family transcriptional regulator [Bacillota bacterium]|nr:TetR/AcrR family transcriptional regulator [Bacillota bacterium]
MVNQSNNRNQKAVETKKRIFDATKALVDTHGIEGVNIRRIARKADISIGTFYRYYSSKDEVIYDMLIYISEKFLADIRGKLKGETYSEKIYDFLICDLRFKSRYIKLYKDILRRILQNKKTDYKFSDYLFSDKNKGYELLRELVTAAREADELVTNINTDNICVTFQAISWGLTDLESIDDDFDLVGYSSRISQTLLSLISPTFKKIPKELFTLEPEKEF